MKKFTVVLLVMIALMALTGCTPEQQEKFDKIAGKVQVGVNAAQGVVSSPAGALMPDGYLLPISWGLTILGAITTAWQRREKKTFKIATDELAYTLDRFESMSDIGNDDMKTAKAEALNPPTIRLLQKMKTAA